MPKGKHKGRNRKFTNFEDLEEQQLKEENQKAWRKARGEDDDDEDSEEKGSEEGSDSEEEESDDESKQQKAKGIQSLIQIENPNHVAAKTKKVTAASTADGKPQLSRREREEIAKQRAEQNYRKLHAEGKTEEARADLERLALIRKQREEASKKKEEEKKAKEAAIQAKKDQVSKFLVKKDKSKS